MVKYLNRHKFSINMSKEKIYKAFFETKENKLYYNQLKELTRLSYSSLQNILKKLEEKKEIVKEKTKSNVFFKLTFLKPIEFAKITVEKINHLNRNVRIPLTEFIDQVPKSIHSVVLFGSSSKKREKENSDIDLLIIFEKFENIELQKNYEKEIRTKINNIHIPTIHNFSIAYTNIEDFKKGEDFLIKEAKDTGFAIVNQQKYYEDLK